MTAVVIELLESKLRLMESFAVLFLEAQMDNGLKSNVQNQFMVKKLD
jgi:hypothetical protein